MKVLLTTLNTKYVHTNIALKYLYETIKNDNIHSLKNKEYEVEKKYLDLINSLNNQISSFKVEWNFFITAEKNCILIFLIKFFKWSVHAEIKMF